MPEFKFVSGEGRAMAVQEMIDEAIRFMKEEPKRTYKIMLGTDSALIDRVSADFVTAIVLHRLGNGARYFWRRVELKPFHTLRDRIIREAMISLEAAQKILSFLKENGAPEFDFEIHVDVGQNGETRTMIQELVGMIRASNFEVKTKPESCAASSVADRHT